MELQEIASVSGKPGLFKVMKPTRTGVILESMDEQKTRLAAGPNHRISVLSEISIYTTTADGSVPLAEVLQTMHKEFGDDPGVDAKSTNEELKAFLQHILPDYDRERVYVSDIKKLLNWYQLLLQQAPEVLKPAEEEKKEASPKTKKKSATTEKE
jgi:hypothetical protein